jgi:hypothetical protein
VGNNSITYNRISNVMRLLRDGGGIYVNGAENRSYESVMAYNYVEFDMAVFAVYYRESRLLCRLAANVPCLTPPLNTYPPRS